MEGNPMRNQQNILGKIFCHRSYGEGEVTAQKDDRMTLRFQDGTERVFSVSVSVLAGAITAVDPEAQEWLKQFRQSDESCRKTSPIRQLEPDQERIVFCNIAWMERYQGLRGDIVPQSGGAYVAKYHEAGEAINFLPFTVSEADGAPEKVCYLGSYETKTRGETNNQTRIERIRGCTLRRTQNHAEHVTVVWCAKNPKDTLGTRVVGWYEDATVWRYYQILPIDEEDGSTWERWFNVQAPVDKGVLLPVEERNEPRWRIPRHKTGASVPFGFGQANIWYASEPEADAFVERIAAQIHAYHQR